MDLARFLLADANDAVGNKAKGNTVGNAVAQRHEQSCEERGNRFGEVLPVDFLECGGHHHAYHDQSRSGSRHGNRADKGGKERADGKADRDNNAGQAGASARADTGSALHEGGGVGRSEDRADGGSRSVRKQSLVHFGLEAGAGIHRLLILRAEDTRTASGSDEGSDGVKGIGNAEGKNGDENQRQLRQIRKQGRKAFRGEDRTEGGRKSRAGVREAHRLSRGGNAHGDTDDRGHNDTDQDRALHIADKKHDGQHQADQEQPENRLVQRCDRRNAGFKADDAHVQKADVCDKYADAAADSVLQALRDGLDDVLAQLGHGDQDVKQTADEHHGQRLLPGEAEAEAYRIGKEGVQSHAGRLSVRHVCHKAHDQRSDDGRDNGRKEYRAPFHSGLAQNARVNRDDVRHGEKGGQTGYDLSGNRGAVLFELKKFLQG